MKGNKALAAAGLLGGLIAIPLVGGLALDLLSVAFGMDKASCYSDSLGPAGMQMDAFRKANGRYPADADEFYSFVAARGDTAEPKHRFRERFLVMPPGVEDPAGKPVLIMCPWDSHGLVRGYAFGLSENGFVRVWSKNSVSWVSK